MSCKKENVNSAWPRKRGREDLPAVATAVLPVMILTTESFFTVQMQEARVAIFVLGIRREIQIVGIIREIGTSGSIRQAIGAVFEVGSLGGFTRRGKTKAIMAELKLLS